MKISIRMPEPGWFNRLLAGSVTAGGALLIAGALGVFVYHAGLLALGAASEYNGWLLAEAVLALIGGLALVQRQRVPAVLGTLGGGLASLLGFPVMYVRENVWPVYFGTAGVALVYSLGTFYFNVGGPFSLALLGGSLLLGTAGVLYHVVRHRWGGYIGLAAAALMVILGVGLLQSDSQQNAAYNAAMIANGEHEWDAQNKLLDASVGGYERELRRNQLWELLFPTPQSDLAALAHFHKANGLLQSPGKGKDAYIELCKSLYRNPGNRYIGLTPDEAARREDNARHTQRNIEKLMRSGQDGGAGQPNGKQGQGKPQQGKQPSRDPGKEPQPSSGRHPRDVL